MHSNESKTPSSSGRGNRHVRAEKRVSGSANPFRALRGIVKKRLTVDRYIEEIRGR